VYEWKSLFGPFTKDPAELEPAQDVTMELVNLESEPVRHRSAAVAAVSVADHCVWFSGRGVLQRGTRRKLFAVVTDLSVGLPTSSRMSRRWGWLPEASRRPSSSRSTSGCSMLGPRSAVPPVRRGVRGRSHEDDGGRHRFYHFFQLRLSPELRELPDHITTELEFLHYPDLPRGGGASDDSDASPLLRAQRDFLERHLCRWHPAARGTAGETADPALLPGFVRFACAFFQRDQAYVSAAAEQWPVNR